MNQASVIKQLVEHGIDSTAANDVVQMITDLPADKAWARLTQTFLKPAHDFALQLRIECHVEGYLSI